MLFRNLLNMFDDINYLGVSSWCKVKALDCEFVLQSRYYVHFRVNTLGKGMSLLILHAMG